MQRFRFPVAVALTALGLVAVVVAAVLVFVPPVRAGALLGGPPWGGGWHGGPWGGQWHGHADLTLPPELASLRDLSPEERFAHFRSAQIHLTDRDGRPLTINVTPGTVSSANSTSLLVAGNDGASKAYTLGQTTILRGQPTAGDRVVVVTLGDSLDALAVVSGVDGHGPFGRGGWEEERR